MVKLLHLHAYLKQKGGCQFDNAAVKVQSVNKTKIIFTEQQNLNLVYLETSITCKKNKLQRMMSAKNFIFVEEINL